MSALWTLLVERDAIRHLIRICVIHRFSPHTNSLPFRSVPALLPKLFQAFHRLRFCTRFLALPQFVEQTGKCKWPLSQPLLRFRPWPLRPRRSPAPASMRLPAPPPSPSRYPRLTCHFYNFCFSQSDLCFKQARQELAHRGSEVCGSADSIWAILLLLPCSSLARCRERWISIRCRRSWMKKFSLELALHVVKFLLLSV